ncbi:MAG: hypothetical protein ABF258_06710 [Flavobacteriales bacterium]
MANKYSDHVFQLIKSLSKAEKRYFKLFIARHTAANAAPNNAQVLFDQMDRMETYNEENLLETLKEKAFTNKFSITKARLYDTVLKSLDAFYSEKSKDQLIRNELHYIEILFNKSLYKQCKKRIHSAKKQAIKYNKTHLLAELILWEKRLIEKDNYHSVDSKKIELLSFEEQDILKSVTLKSQLWELKALLFQKLNKIGRARTEEEILQLKNEVGTKIDEIEIPNNKIGLNYLFNHIQGAYFFAIYDYKKSLAIVLETIDLIEKNPNEFSDEPNILISTLTNGVYLAMKTSEIEKAQELYDKLKILYKKQEENGSRDLVLKIKSSLLSLQLLLIKLTCNFQEFTKIAPVITTFISDNKSKLNESRLAFLYYNLAHILFVQDEFSASLKWTNALLNDIDIDKSQEIYSFAEILNLFIHLELDNKELVNYTIKSTKRFLKTRNKLFQYETIVLKFIQKISNYKFDKYDMEEQLESLITNLRAETNNSFENIPFEYFDCVAWAESKLKKKNLSQIIKTQNEKFSTFKF